MKEPKEKITISIDRSLLARIDAVVGARADSRSGVIERLLYEGIRGDELMVSGLENSVGRALVSVMMSSAPVVNELVGLVARRLTSEELRDVQEEAKKQLQRGRERQRAKGQGKIARVAFE